VDEALAQWLALREPADRTSRSEPLTRAIADRLPADAPLHALDLATGTGSNIRYLAERLGREQRWLAADRSAALLAALPDRMAEWAAARGYELDRAGATCTVRGPALDCRVETRQADLGALVDSRLFVARHLVTASALLDLVSVSWLQALAERCRAAGASVLFTITYNGRSSCLPVEPEDEMVRTLMNRHQKTDKGLGGPAAGPDAVDAAARSFAAVGYRVERQPSDWTLGPGDVEFQRQLIEGWAQAASEIAPGQRGTIERWRARRMVHVEAGISQVTVGHEDLAGWLPR
jgi:hypothetical protein